MQLNPNLTPSARTRSARKTSCATARQPRFGSDETGPTAPLPQDVKIRLSQDPETFLGRQGQPDGE